MHKSFYDYDMEEAKDCLCDTCSDKDFCDGWEAMFCCILCRWQGQITVTTVIRLISKG